MGKDTYILTIHHYGHTRIDFKIPYKLGITLAIQASNQLSEQGRWRRDTSGHTGLIHHLNLYFDQYVEGHVLLRSVNESNEKQ